MAELKPWIKRIRCRLTGGHMYRDMGIVTRYEPITDRYWFGNRCIKCGQFNTWDVDAKALFEEGFARKKGDGDG